MVIETDARDFGRREGGMEGGRRKRLLCRAFGTSVRGKRVEGVLGPHSTSLLPDQLLIAQSAR